MVDLGSGNQREIDDLMLTRHACYLIAQELGVAQGAWPESGNLFFTIRPGFAPGRERLRSLVTVGLLLGALTMRLVRMDASDRGSR